MKKTTSFREGIWRLSGYGLREGRNEWNTVSADCDNTINLVLKNMNLFLNCGKTLVENFSLVTNDVQRVIYKKDTMAFVIQQEAAEVRYLKIKFDGMAFFSGEAMCKQCVDILSHYIPMDQNSGTHSDQISNKMSVSTFLSELLNKNPIEPFTNRKDLRSTYPMEEMIDECILDTDFPSVVTEVANILSLKLKNE